MASTGGTFTDVMEDFVEEVDAAAVPLTAEGMLSPVIGRASRVIETSSTSLSLTPGRVSLDLSRSR